jgi:hypothetical protein
MRATTALVAAFAFAACDESSPPARAASPDAGALSPDAGPADPFVDALEAVVPGDGLPPEVVTQAANNNLDVVDHDGRLFLAFRTAPSHFASAETRLWVVSTADERTWRLEGAFFKGTDLREPRLLSLNGRLFLYYAVLGADRLAFEPQGTERAEWLGPGEFSDPVPALDGDFIPWRVRVHDGVAHMTAYTGGEGVYVMGGEPIRVYWLTSRDGEAWAPFDPAHPVVLEGGASETDFAFAPDGAVVAVARNEAGDPEFGYGSKICRGEPGALATWRCAADPRKFDSPLVFAHGGRIWLVARRNLTETGAFDLGRDDLDPAARYGLYQTDYWGKPKRCALWEIDPSALTARFVLDLPSRGDTCFASVVPRGDDAYALFNYSSPLDVPPDAPDLSWLQGQTGRTLVYRQRLVLPSGR